METGDYARTKSGIIGKIIIKEDTIAVAKWQGGYELQDTTTYIINDEKVYKNEIVKSSPNIIDLIEEGDYVNGCYVLREHYTYMGEHFIELDTNDSWEWGIGNMPTKYIKSILTKEQFEQMEYKL